MSSVTKEEMQVLSVAMEDAATQLEQSYDEINRLYEIIAVTIPVAEMYLSQVNPSNDEETDSVNIVRDAVEAAKFGQTIAQAKQEREEASDE